MFLSGSRYRLGNSKVDLNLKERSTPKAEKQHWPQIPSKRPRSLWVTLRNRHKLSGTVRKQDVNLMLVTGNPGLHAGSAQWIDGFASGHLDLQVTEK